MELAALSPSWKKTFQELIDLRGNALQIAQYVAVIAGLKRSIDDWIPWSQIEAYQRIAAKLGLTCVLDCIFAQLPKTRLPFGSEWAPTTRNLGRALSEEQIAQIITGNKSNTLESSLGVKADDQIHVVLAQRPESAAETLGAAWYPLVINNRVVYKPNIDSYRLGAALGYPKCCVKFFMEHNDWPRQNQYAESAKVSSSFSWKANCLAKNTPWMLIFHMPCAFDCPATLEYSTLLLREIRGFDPHRADSIEKYLKQTIFVCNERLAFTLLSAKQHEDGRTSYKGVKSLQQFIRLRDPQHDRYVEALNAGDSLDILDGVTFIWKERRLERKIESFCDHPVAEVPLLLDFG